jgi:hypothetical protein
MRQLGWWSGDDHVHTRIVSDDDARQVMAWVRAEDVHLANIVKMGDIYRTYFEQRGFGPSNRVIEGEHVLAPGQECPRTHDQIGQALAMNITAMVRDPERYFPTTPFSTPFMPRAVSPATPTPTPDCSTSIAT